MNASQWIIATGLMLAAVLLGCAPMPVEGRYSYAIETDFSEFESFALADVDEGVFSTPESSAHFRIAIVRALSAKGFTENPKNPDFWIFAAPVETYREMYVLSGNVVIPTGMLRVSFQRPSGGPHIYEAAAFAYFESSWSQEDKDAVIDEAVQVIVAEFPPSR